MLRTLSIRDVVLIGRLEITFKSGLCTLTGETGAGKSILLDALGLALGQRADARLVRHGAEQASVTAVFETGPEPPVAGLLADQEIESEDGQIILRRVLGADGRSRAFINDQPVSAGLLRRVGEDLAEIHGQFENQRLLNPAVHRALLDSFGGLDGAAGGVAKAHQAWARATDERARAAAALEQARRDEEYLRHAADELARLDPQTGEEETLAARRAMMMHGEKLMEALGRAAAELDAGPGVEGALRAGLRHLEQVADKAEGRLDDVIRTLEQAALEAAEGAALLERLSAQVDLDPARLEEAEERLFGLRALARKHGVETDALAQVHADISTQLAALEDGGADLARLERAESEARAAYVAAAEKLSAARAKAAAKLDKAVAAELEPLRLGKARFVTVLEPLGEDAWGETGCERVVFQVATNPGAPPGPLNKIASGGELSRFSLALKAVLAGADPVPTIVFDEVDSGVGGAVAAAVGERLAKLAGTAQVLVVTHSPQVAARAGHHWQVSKSDNGKGVLTTVDALDDAARREEIARMLAGESVTDEARAAAESLIGGARP